MFIVWGFRARAKKLSEGQFFCPRCGVDRGYVLEKLVRWFTLFWIPLFPTGKEYGEQVRCTTCSTTFRPEILAAPTSAALTESIRTAGRIAAIAVLRAGDPHQPTARTAAVDSVCAAGNDGYDDDALSADLAQIDPSQLDAYVTPLAQGLQQQGKENFVARVAAIAHADGTMSNDEQRVLHAIGASLQLSSAHVTGVLATSGQSPQTGQLPPAMPSLPVWSASAFASGAGPSPAAAAEVAPTAPAVAPTPAPTATSQAAGWYADPAGSESKRWWDGTGWTDHLHPPG